MDKFPEFPTSELVEWLQAKYRRHGEIEDGVAAERLKLLTVEIERCHSVLRQVRDAYPAPPEGASFVLDDWFIAACEIVGPGDDELPTGGTE